MLVYWEWKDDDLLDVRDYNPLEILTKKSWHKNLKLPNAINLLFSLGSLGSGATGSWNLIHQKFQVPNAGFPEPFLGYYGGWVFPYIGRIHTAYIGEDSSILGTWNVWWLMASVLFSSPQAIFCPVVLVSLVKD